MTKRPSPESGKTKKEIEALETVLSEPVQLVEKGGSRFLIYDTGRGPGVELKYEGESLWLTQAQLGELFGVTRNNINMHLSNIFTEGELSENAVSKESLLTAADGKRRGRSAPRYLVAYESPLPMVDSGLVIFDF